MSQEVIRDFLNVPGIEGFALICGQLQPFFYCKNSKFDVRQPEALFQGILQVVETIPPNFEGFEFHFAESQVCFYRLSSNAVLLVALNETVVDPMTSEQIQTIRQWIESDFAIATEILRHYSLTETSSSVSQGLDSPTLQDLIDALNALCEFTAQFLGAAVIVNYLKSSRPDNVWLQQFEIERSATRSSQGSSRVTFLGELSSMEQPLNTEELEILRCWISAFVRRCSQAVRDYETLVKQNAPPELQKILLSQ